MQQQLQLEPQLVQLIQREVRSGRKADFLEVLHRYANQLRKIPIPPQDVVDTAQAFRDAIREDVVLNGVRFVGDHRMEAYVAAIKRIVSKFTPDRHRCLEISDRILKSCSRTATGADSYFALEKLFGASNKNLLIKPRDEDPPPLDVKIGLEHDKLKCRIVTVNLFGLYRHADIDHLFKFQAQDQIDAWIQIDTVLVEFIDFSTNESTRCLTIQTPEPAPQLPTEVKELF